MNCGFQNKIYSQSMSCESGTVYHERQGTDEVETQIDIKLNCISAMFDLATSIIYIPDEGPRGVSGLVPNMCDQCF